MNEQKPYFPLDFVENEDNEEVLGAHFRKNFRVCREIPKSPYTFNWG